MKRKVYIENCTYITNSINLHVMLGLCAAQGYRLPGLVTPFQLMEACQ